MIELMAINFHCKAIVYALTSTGDISKKLASCLKQSNRYRHYTEGDVSFFIFDIKTRWKIQLVIDQSSIVIYPRIECPKEVTDDLMNLIASNVDKSMKKVIEMDY